MKVPLAHGVHTRSDEALAAVVSYSPAWHVVTAWHTRSDVAVGAANVNWPPGHDAVCVLQSRSEEVVGMTFSYSSDVHSVTATHAPPSLALEYVLPDAHAAHWRSATAEPAVVIPWPIGHVDHAVHVLRPAEAVKVPGAQSAHVRSLDAVAAAVVKLPAAHCALTGTHVLPPSVDVYVTPASHAAHWRSAVAEPGTDTPSPAAHVVHGEHALRPGEAVKVPCAHSVHTRSLVAVAVAVM